MSKISRRSKEGKSIGDQNHFFHRIQKTLYYGKLPTTDRLSLPITELASELFSEPRNGRSLDRLHCKDAAHISREACITPCSFVLGMLYLERLKACNPEYLQHVAPSQLFLVSLMVSSKFLYDIGEDCGVVMSEWAASGGVSVEELIDLEKEFLNAIQWNIFVKESAFWQKFNALESTLAKREGRYRGYYTYTELGLLLETIDIHALISAVATIMTVFLTTYTAGFLTILGSMFIASQIPGHMLNQPQTQFSLTWPQIENDTVIYDDNLNLSLDEMNKPALNVMGVFQTGIILASIQSPMNENLYFEDDTNKEEITWDWWNNPSMTWLSHVSRLAETFKLFTSTKYTHDHFVEMSIANSKKIQLEDKLHKETMIRMQDVLEKSWHTEWTASIKDFLSYNDITHFFQDIKA